MIYISRIKNATVLGVVMGSIMHFIRSSMLASGQKFNYHWYTCRSNSDGRFLKIIHSMDETTNHKKFSRHPCFSMSYIFRGNESKMEQLLVFSQVFLSIALPFSLIPLQLATSNKTLMGPFQNKNGVNICAWSFIILS